MSAKTQASKQYLSEFEYFLRINLISSVKIYPRENVSQLSLVKTTFGFQLFLTNLLISTLNQRKYCRIENSIDYWVEIFKIYDSLEMLEKKQKYFK
jgi:hypothetical protein